MPSESGQGDILKREVRLERHASDLLADYARFVEVNAEDALNIVLRKIMANDAHFQSWKNHRKSPAAGQPGSPATPCECRGPGGGMIERILFSRGAIAGLLAMATGMTLYFRMPFPEDNFFFELIYLWQRPLFWGFKCTCILLLYPTPFIGYSILVSGLYVFALKDRRRDKPGRLPHDQDPRNREYLSIVVGEVHNPQKAIPSANPRWLTISERGLFTGIAIFGAIGSGKMSRCIYPFAYDGLIPMPPLFCYFKPHSDDLNKSYFPQAADGEV